ncbi:hypothetical protein [Desulfogranum japonicum]|uniref:hypothetical protein n=1 Tax=Desulfogranum japonicum TaxID=231447 RepID=UPI00041054C0|nr:hypothetical protein [Desulfogranum japonicum]
MSKERLFLLFSLSTFGCLLGYYNAYKATIILFSLWSIAIRSPATYSEKMSFRREKISRIEMLDILAKLSMLPVLLIAFIELPDDYLESLLCKPSFLAAVWVFLNLMNIDIYFKQNVAIQRLRKT